MTEYTFTKIICIARLVSDCWRKAKQWTWQATALPLTSEPSPMSSEFFLADYDVLRLKYFKYDVIKHCKTAQLAHLGFPYGKVQKRKWLDTHDHDIMPIAHPSTWWLWFQPIIKHNSRDPDRHCHRKLWAVHSGVKGVSKIKEFHKIKLTTRPPQWQDQLSASPALSSQTRPLSLTRVLPTLGSPIPGSLEYLQVL